MHSFESLEAQVLKAQRTVDVVGLAEWGEAVTVNIVSHGLVQAKLKARTDARENVAMPDSWLKELAGFADASATGLDYLARFARRHRFVSIHAASRWLLIEKTERLLAGLHKSGGPLRQGSPVDESASGVDALLARADSASASRSRSLFGFTQELMDWGKFQVAEAQDALRRAERKRR